MHLMMFICRMTVGVSYRKNIRNYSNFHTIVATSNLSETQMNVFDKASQLFQMPFNRNDGL